MPLGFEDEKLSGASFKKITPRDSALTHSLVRALNSIGQVAGM
jgi:hypothetical protein